MTPLLRTVIVAVVAGLLFPYGPTYADEIRTRDALMKLGPPQQSHAGRWRRVLAVADETASIR